MKRFVLALAAVSLVCLFCEESNAQIFGRRRGGGGNMGGGQICNMAQCQIQPGQCAGGACNAQVAPAPAAPVAPPADVAPTSLTRKAPRKASKASRHSFDVPTEPKTALARR